VRRQGLAIFSACAGWGDCWAGSLPPPGTGPSHSRGPIPYALPRPNRGLPSAQYPAVWAAHFGGPGPIGPARGGLLRNVGVTEFLEVRRAIAPKWSLCPIARVTQYHARYVTTVARARTSRRSGTATCPPSTPGPATLHRATLSARGCSAGLAIARRAQPPVSRGPSNTTPMAHGLG
jgi:hypothetical protein